jgi:hypothetical protein
MTETELLDLTIPVRTFEDSLLRVVVREHNRRSMVIRGLVDSSPNEPWRICSPADLKAGRLRMLERAAKPGETVKQTVARIEAGQFERRKRGRK